MLGLAIGHQGSDKGPVECAVLGHELLQYFILGVGPVLAASMPRHNIRIQYEGEKRRGARRLAKNSRKHSPLPESRAER